MNRRLPVYLLIDCSESMIGGGIEAVRAGLSSMLSKLRTDPHALDTVHLSVITFDAEARALLPMTPLLEFQEPVLLVRPGTALGAALNLLADRIQAEVRKTSHHAKGDYRPLVLLLTDGQPSDDWRAPIARIGAQVQPRPANIYAIGCGVDVDYSVLQSVTDVVLRMEDMGADSFGKLFVWLTASVSSASQGVGETVGGKIKLGKLPSNVEVFEGVCDAVAPEDKLGVGDADTVDVAVGDGVAARLLVELGVLVTLPVPLPELVGVGVSAADTVVVAVTLPVPLLEGV